MSPYFDGNVSLLGSLWADSKQTDLRDEGDVTHGVLILKNRFKKCVTYKYVILRFPD